MQAVTRGFTQIYGDHFTTFSRIAKLASFRTIISFDFNGAYLFESLAN